MRIIRDLLSLALVASGLLGSQILLNDKWLWSAAPSHAYGLIGFVAIDLLLVVAVLRKGGIAVLGAAVVSAAQFGAMFADMIGGQPTGVPSVAFRAYLTSDTTYLALLIIQVAIVTVAAGAMTGPLWHRVANWTRFQHQSKPAAP